MWIWRKMEKISWTAKVSNSEVLNRVKENRCIISKINQRKRRWLGHVLWHDVLLRDVLEGRMTGKRTRGRSRLQLMSNICEGYETAKKRAEDRCLWCVSVMAVIDLLLQQNTRRERDSIDFCMPLPAGHLVILWLWALTIWLQKLKCLSFSQNAPMPTVWRKYVNTFQDSANDVPDKWTHRRRKSLKTLCPQLHYIGRGIKNMFYSMVYWTSVIVKNGNKTD